MNKEKIMQVYDIKFGNDEDDPISGYVIPLNETTVEDLEKHFTDNSMCVEWVWPWYGFSKDDIGCTIDGTENFSDKDWKLLAVKESLNTDDGQVVEYEYISWGTLREAVWNLPLRKKVFRDHYEWIAEIYDNTKRDIDAFNDEVDDWLFDTDFDDLIDIIKFAHKHGYPKV